MPGEVLIRIGDRKNDLPVVVGRPLEFEAGTELDIMNTGVECLAFTVFTTK